MDIFLIVFYSGYADFAMESIFGKDSFNVFQIVLFRKTEKNSGFKRYWYLNSVRIIIFVLISLSIA